MSDTTKGKGKRSRSAGAFGDVAKQYATSAADDTPAAQPGKPGPAGVYQARIKSTPTTRTGGGLLRRTVYFEPDEWAAVLAEAHRRDMSAAALVREAVRQALGMGAAS